MLSLKEIDIKCLANMPMMLDVISSTTNKLERVFDEIFPKIDDQLLGTELYDEAEWNFVYTPFSLNAPKGNRGLQSLAPEFQILYEKSFYRKEGRKTISFEVSFGYVVDETQNAIYFQLSECDTEYINEQAVAEIKQAMADNHKWNIGFDAGDRIWLEFPVDENITKEKILSLLKDFQAYILSKLLGR